MRTILARLQRGERLWPAEIALRMIGLALLYSCSLLAGALYRQVQQLPPHSGTPAEMAIAAIFVCCLWTGLALAIEGPGLLRPVPKPPRAYL